MNKVLVDFKDAMSVSKANSFCDVNYRRHGFFIINVVSSLYCLNLSFAIQDIHIEAISKLS